MNRPKAYDNRAVSQCLEAYIKVRELCDDHPRADDIISGVLAAKTEGSTSTRTLRRGSLFAILQHCSEITAEEIQRVLGRDISLRTARAYAVVARVASRALEPVLLGAALAGRR